MWAKKFLKIKNIMLNNNNFNRPTPFFIVARFMFSNTYRILGISQALYPFVFGFFNLLPTMVSVLGVLPAIKIMWNMRDVLHGLRPLESLNVLGTEIEKTLVEFIRLHWASLLTNRISCLRFIFSIIITLIVYKLKPITKHILRVSISLMLSAMGILYSDLLRSIQFLLDYAYYIRDLFKPVVEIKLPKELQSS